MNERLLSTVGAVYSDKHFSRRTFLRVVAAIPFAAAGLVVEPDGRDAIDEAWCQADIYWPREKAYSQYDVYVKDYPHASEATYASIFSSLDIKPIPSNVQRFTGTDRLVRIETTLDSDQLLLLDVSGVNDPDWGLRAVEVKTEERDYYQPIILTEQNKTGRMNIGQQKAGRIAFDILSTHFSRGITSGNIGVQLLRVEGNKMCMSLMRLLNNLYLREDNDTKEGFLANDFPILAEAYLRENIATKRIMWEKWQKLTCQDRGAPLCRALAVNKTTNDNEVLGIDILTEEALLVGQVDQGEQHAIVPFQTYDQPIPVTGDVNVNLQLHQKNNMTKREITTSHAVALFPFLPYGKVSELYAHLKLAAEVFGARERLREGGLDDDFVKRLVKRVGRDVIREAYAYKDMT